MLLNHIKGVPAWVSASVLASFNAMPFGLDTGTIGPVTSMPSFIATFGHFSATLHGVIVSSILITGVLGALVAGNLADRFGRTLVTASGSLIFCVGAAIEASSFWLPMFIVGRLIKGLGEGFFLSTAYVLVSEISPAARRGTMANIPQLLITMGIVIGFFTCYGTEAIPGSLSWRIPLIVQAVIAATNATTCALLVPQSPRWLLATGRHDAAAKVVAALQIGREEQDELLCSSSGDLLDNDPNLSFLQSLKATLREFRAAFAPKVRGRTLFGCFIMGMLQFSGIDGVLYYAPMLFAQAGMDSTEASFLASGVSAIVILIVTIPATLLCDSWGRKTSAVTGGAGIVACMVVIGGIYASGITEEVSADGSGVTKRADMARTAVMVMIYLFAAVFSATWALGFRMSMIESLPRKTRSSGASLAQASNWMCNYIVALTTPVFLDSSTSGAYFFFAGMSLVCTLVCLAYMSETKGHSLEYIEQSYALKQAAHRATRDRWLRRLGLKGSGDDDRSRRPTGGNDEFDSGAATPAVGVVTMVGEKYEGRTETGGDKKSAGAATTTTTAVNSGASTLCNTSPAPSILGFRSEK